MPALKPIAGAVIELSLILASALLKSVPKSYEWKGFKRIFPVVTTDDSAANAPASHLMVTLFSNIKCNYRPIGSYRYHQSYEHNNDSLTTIVIVNRSGIAILTMKISDLPYRSLNHLIVLLTLGSTGLQPPPTRNARRLPGPSVACGPCPGWPAGELNQLDQLMNHGIFRWLAMVDSGYGGEPTISSIVNHD